MDKYEKYLDDSGYLKDNKIIEDIRKAADMYDNGEIVETHDLLLDIISVLDDWMKIRFKDGIYIKAEISPISKEQ